MYINLSCNIVRVHNLWWIRVRICHLFWNNLAVWSWLACSWKMDFPRFEIVWVLLLSCNLMALQGRKPYHRFHQISPSTSVQGRSHPVRIPRERASSPILSWACPMFEYTKHSECPYLLIPAPRVLPLQLLDCGKIIGLVNLG